MAQSWISLTTDYGLTDGFVAACHGVLARLAPQARIIDVTHLIPAADVRRGAAVLAQTVPYLPWGVHVAVVDPGVGTDRRGVGLATPGGFLVGPDNGLLVDAALALGGIGAAVELTDPRWLASRVSRTFHGRDVFAPVAARLAGGDPLAAAGPAVDPDTLVRLPTPTVRADTDGLTAEVSTVDHFGNVQLAAPAALLDALPPTLTVTGHPAAPARAGFPAAPARAGQPAAPARAGQPAAPARAGQPAVRGETFADAGHGELVVYGDSADRVAIAVNGGRAVDLLAVTPGDLLTVSARSR
ncbi:MULTISPECIES: SAM hydrolase/SAM-dependent halogenase family protein [Micromonospora]|uniref:S-adenosyl-l-methionine hydroxide adenosyltransferase n=1 Tax=Micromonospora yangpuensis TaxID=683228 RepID=A0A1C6UCH2_9ACTN|nr:SAM-dependent chlorinase/fluorinase [Micromonospora yangpuensis]GGM26419.1 hypothetical protein GCM10012279_51120 [Micromonospora yangpuensis]SCL51800.1 hypothetical protein GA0070617_1891 [Micromonospora yangpuensis]